MMRSLARLLLGLVIAALVLVSGWLVFHLVPRDEYFAERHGTLQATDAGPLVEHPGGFVSRQLRLSNDNGLSVRARLLRPANVDEPLPGIVLLGGHRTGQDAVDVIGDPDGIAVLALDYPYRGDDDFGTLSSFLWNVGSLQRGLLDTPPALMLGLDWLLEQPWIDPRRVELVGVSLGTPFATVAGAVDDRFARVWIIHGGADVRRWIEDNLDRVLPQAWLRAPASWFLYAVAYGPSFRPEKWVGQISPRPVVLVGARQDERLAPEQVQALYDAAGQPRELVWMGGPHVNTGRPEIVGALLEIVRSRMLPSSPVTSPGAPP
ncbi:MAG: hypothetical protein P8080_01795 [Gammaproteobacteria bacterium]